MRRRRNGEEGKRKWGGGEVGGKGGNEKGGNGGGEKWGGKRKGKIRKEM